SGQQFFGWTDELQNVRHDYPPANGRMISLAPSSTSCYRRKKCGWTSPSLGTLRRSNTGTERCVGDDDHGHPVRRMLRRLSPRKLATLLCSGDSDSGDFGTSPRNLLELCGSAKG